MTLICPYWSVEPMCNCPVCQEEIRKGTHISQQGPNAEIYAAARLKAYGEPK